MLHTAGPEASPVASRGAPEYLRDMDRERLAWLWIAHVAAEGAVLVGLWVAVVWARANVGASWPLDVFAGPEPVLQVVSVARHLRVALLIVPLWLASLTHRGWYRGSSGRRPPGWSAFLSGSGLALLLFLGLAFVLKLEWVSRTVVFGFAGGSLVVLPLTRCAVTGALRRLGPRLAPERVLLVGDAAGVAPYLAAVARHPEWGIEVVGRVGDSREGPCTWLGETEQLAPLLVERPIDEVVLTELRDDLLRSTARSCEEIGVRLSIDANFLGLRTSHAVVHDFEGWSLLTFANGPRDGVALALKRALDVAGALAGLVLLAPVLLGVALALRLSDGGPVLYVQERAGRFGCSFRMLKFRTMVPDAEVQRASLSSRSDTGPAFKLRRDPRITRVGAFLRRSSLDELPQLLNVLRGEMSLVGPRPPLPGEVEHYERWQLRRLSMRPGLTCIWQVSGRSTLPFDQWMALDLAYIDSWSLGLDLWLLLRTIPAVVSGRGAW